MTGTLISEAVDFDFGSLPYGGEGITVSDQPSRTEDAFGYGFMLKQVADDVRSIRNDMAGFASKAEVAYVVGKIEQFVPKGDIDRRFDERDARNSQQVSELKDLMKEGLRDIKKSTSDSIDAMEKRIENGPFAKWVVPVVTAGTAIAALIVSLFHPIR